MAESEKVIISIAENLQAFKLEFRDYDDNDVRLFATCAIDLCLGLRTSRVFLAKINEHEIKEAVGFFLRELKPYIAKFFTISLTMVNHFKEGEIVNSWGWVDNDTVIISAEYKELVEDDS